MGAIVVRPGGLGIAVYTDDLPLDLLGPFAIRRASHVEPDAAGQWWADLAPVGGPALGPFVRRTEALSAEAKWLDDRLADLPLD